MLAWPQTQEQLRSLQNAVQQRSTGACSDGGRRRVPLPADALEVVGVGVLPGQADGGAQDVVRDVEGVHQGQALRTQGFFIHMSANEAAQSQVQDWPGGRLTTARVARNTWAPLHHC